MVAQVQQAQTSSLYIKHPQHKLHRIVASPAALVDIVACCKKLLQQLISKSSAACSRLWSFVRRHLQPYLFVSKTKL